MIAAQTRAATVSGIAAAIGEPARARILYSLLDGRARTSTELAVVANVTASTTSVHLSRLKEQRLVKVFVQGKHRYYSLEGPDVANVLEALNTVAAGTRAPFVPNTPSALLEARTCYDHVAGKLGVLLHNRLKTLGWLTVESDGKDEEYELTDAGAKRLQLLGIDLNATRILRRRFAYGCLDWSERQPHLGGALGAAILTAMLKRKWVVQEVGSRALNLTRLGRSQLRTQFGLQV